MNIIGENCQINFKIVVKSEKYGKNTLTAFDVDMKNLITVAENSDLTTQLYVDFYGLGEGLLILKKNI